MTDKEIILKHAPHVRNRARMELKVVRKTIREAHKAGYTLSVWNGDEDSGIVTERKAIDLLFDLDQAHLYFHKNRKTVGWVFFVLGNNGWDAINDYTVNLEPVMKEVEKLVDQLESGVDF